MSFRIEEKLSIDSSRVIDFKSFLAKKAVKQIHQRRKIESLYFENLNYDMYTDSIEGVAPRKKIRIREYLNADDKNYYLETKHSSVEGRFKTRKILNNKDVNFYKKSGCFDSQYGTCLPNFYVTYEREYSAIEDIRISIDRNLVYKSFKSSNIYNDKNCIVEIKTSIKKNLDDLIKLFPFQRIRFSKYCFAVDTLKQSG